MTPRPSSHTPGAGAIAAVVRRVAGASARRPKAAIALWLVLVIGCLAGGALTGTKTLTDAQSGVGESAKVDERLDAAKLRDPAVENVLVRSGDAATTRAVAREVQRRLGALDHDVASVHGPQDTAGLSTAGGRTVLVQASLRGDPDHAKDRVAPVQDAVAAVAAAHPGVTVVQSGDASFDKAIDQVVEHDLQRAEIISLPLTLVLLLLAFGALVAASVPLLLGITSVAAALGALGVVSQVAPNSDSTASLVVLMGLAVGVDYSLFYIRREREERRNGAGAHAAIEAAAATVGRAVLVSGITVCVALAGLLLTGISVFTSMALGSIVVVAIAVLGSLTVLPAVLVKLGDRIDRGRLPFIARRRERRAIAEAQSGAPRRGPAAALARAVTRRPAVALVTAVCVLGALAVPAFSLHTADPGADSLPQDVPVVQAQKQIEAAFPGGTDNAKLVVQGKDLGSKTARERLDAFGARAEHVTGGHGRVEVAVSRDGRTAQVLVPMPDDGVDAGRAAVRRLRSEVSPTAARIGPGAHALVGGSVAGDLDFTDRMSSRTPLVIGLVLAIAFALLIGTFRSARLAASVIALNLLSIGATYGIMVAVFQHTWAEQALDFTSSGSIAPWLPLLTFVILFGLSMDYTVLVLERIREARRAGLSPRAAAADGVAATSGTVTSAAIVMVAVFSIFAMLRMLEMKQLGIGMAAAVALDATIVRGVALPAAVALLGERGMRVPSPVRRRVSGWDTAARTPLAAQGSTEGR